LTFLAFLDRGARKGGLAALQAFLMAFGEDMNYRLILKGRKPKVPLTLTNPNITVIQQDMSEQELYELYLSADVLINCNKGEGFGLIPREFAATGGISLATGWGGTVDNINDWGVRLPYELEPADWKGVKSLAGFDLGEWAKPDLEGCAVVLRRVAENIDWFRAGAYRKAKNAAALYSWRAFAEQVLDVWQEVSAGKAFDKWFDHVTSHLEGRQVGNATGATAIEA
jgi:glycosyltransferase involved in cell wall biosynthesis